MNNDELLPGAAVRTAAALEQRDFLPETIRRASVNGLVVRSKTGHGLCYEVRHVDGECGWYDPDELTKLAPVESALRVSPDRACCRMCETAWLAVNGKTELDRKSIFPCPKCKLWCCPRVADHRNTCIGDAAVL